MRKERIKWEMRWLVAKVTAGNSQVIMPYLKNKVYEAPKLHPDYGTGQEAFDSGAVAVRLAQLAGSNVRSYREGVKTHKGAGKDSKAEQLARVLRIALDRYQAGDLFNCETENSYFNSFKEAYEDNVDDFDHVCVQINATDKAVEPQILSLSDAPTIQNRRLLYELYPPGGWPDFKAYEGTNESLLELAMGAFYIERFLEENGHSFSQSCRGCGT